MTSIVNNTTEAEGQVTPTSWAKLILQLGVVAVIAIYLVYSLNEIVRASLDDTKKGITRVEEAQRLHSVDTSYQMKQMNSVQGLLRSICVNAANGRAERDNCVKEGN